MPVTKVRESVALMRIIYQIFIYIIYLYINI